MEEFLPAPRLLWLFLDVVQSLLAGRRRWGLAQLGVTFCSVRFGMFGIFGILRYSVLEPPNLIPNTEKY